MELKHDCWFHFWYLLCILCIFIEISFIEISFIVLFDMTVLAKVFPL